MLNNNNNNDNTNTMENGNEEEVWKKFFGNAFIPYIFNWQDDIIFLNVLKYLNIDYTMVPDWVMRIVYGKHEIIMEINKEIKKRIKLNSKSEVGNDNVCKENNNKNNKNDNNNNHEKRNNGNDKSAVGNDNENDNSNNHNQNNSGKNGNESVQSPIVYYDNVQGCALNLTEQSMNVLDGLIGEPCGISFLSIGCYVSDVLPVTFGTQSFENLKDDNNVQHGIQYNYIVTVIDPG